ncbi:MAG: class I mannose-6-phosphate isomerase [Phycisphaerales bacterium]|nr:class I mannose-6-phosphate isomerase [Phycisphaerales bacterium]
MPHLVYDRAALNGVNAVNVCPLVFDPIYKPKIWGGRRLESLAGKRLPPDEPIGESWELADLENDQSAVRDGPARGWPLSRLVHEWGRDLLGSAQLFGGRFPLLIKFLDAQETLSVQVHPDQAMADRLGGDVRVKNEAWYVLHTEPDGVIYHGLADGVTRARFVDAIASGTVASTLRRVPVKPGACYYLPSGTVHALGAGVVVAEIQTPSDITYRVYDWDRIDPSTGKGRTLHIDDALQCIQFGPAQPPEQPRSHVGSVWTAVTSLVRCDSFVIERVRMVEGVEQTIPTGEMLVWMALSGRAEILYGRGESLVFQRGDTVLIPAGLGDARLKTDAVCEWLEVTIPIESDLKHFERPDRAALNQPEDRGFVSLNLPDSAGRTRSD